MSNAINVVMVGPQGSGKTSILSVMLHDVEQFVGALTQSEPSFRDLRVLPSLKAIGQAHETLKDGRQQLNNLALAARKTGRDSTASVDMSEGMIMGDKTSRCTPVSFKMGKHETVVNFWDFPGGVYSAAYIGRNAEKGYALISKESIQKWEEIIKNADVVLLTVDASTQLGKDPFLKDRTYYSRITELVKESIRHSMTTLVFVPVKCEHMAIDATYDEVLNEIETPLSKTGCQDLRKKVEALFPDLVKIVRDPNAWGNVEAFFAPMITVGGIKCNGRTFDPRTAKGTIRFSPIVPAHYEKTPFLPQNCDKVFALCLLRAYKPLVEEWKNSRNVLQRLGDAAARLFGVQTPFEVFFDKFAHSIHFEKMIGDYYSANPDELKNEGLSDEQITKLLDIFKTWSNDYPEDGCEALNKVLWPTSIR